MRTAAILLVAALAGCVADAPEPLPEPLVPEPMAYPRVVGDGAQVLLELKHLVNIAPQRYDNLFDHETARTYLAGLWQDAGLNVSRQSFSGAGQTSSPIVGENIVATLAGATNHTLLIGAHYDSAASSVGAAYDDGTGTMLVVELARALSGRAWNNTIEAVLFDQEEAGLVGSGFSAQTARDENKPLTLMINLDMIGINWPVGVGGSVNPIPVDFFVGGDSEDALVTVWREGVSAAGYPDAASSQQTGLGGGSSDHGPFRNAAFPAAWLRGALIGSYPAYHNLDRVETMSALVGGDDNLVAAFQTVLDMLISFIEQLDDLVQIPRQTA